MPNRLLAPVLIYLALCHLASCQPRNASVETPRFDTAQFREVLRQRDSVSLNGEWQYMPATGDAATQPVGNWQQRPVPDEKGEHDRMWYQRQVLVPADWTGRAVLLDFERVSTDATLWVNGQETGVIRWPGGTVDITEQITPGKANQLRLLVVAVDDLDQVTRYMGYAQEATEKADLKHRGLIGDVMLRSRPRAGHVADVYLEPSVRESSLTLHVELENVPSDGPVRFRAGMLDEQGKLERVFEVERKVPAGSSKPELVFEWEDPRLWDYDQPSLYTMQLLVQGQAIEDAVSQRFGFREFWIEGRKFFLNGTEIKLRPNTFGAFAKDVPSVKAEIDKGYNFLEMWPTDYTRRGTLDPLRHLADATDEAGMLLAANVAFMKRTVRGRNWEDDAIREQWMRIMEQDVRHWRNHPSVVMYVHTGNAFAVLSDGDPWLLGQKDFSVVQEHVVEQSRVRQLINEIQKLDPKPVFAHHGGYNGDVYTSDLFLNFLPLQEREEFLSYWTEHGDMPYMAVEFGLPLYATVMRARGGYGYQGKSEPFMTEWAARLIGSEAYPLEPKEYRQEVIAKRYKGDDPQAEYAPHIRFDHRQKIIEQAPAYQKILDIFIPRTYRSWRGLGITGGMIPWTGGDFPQVHEVNGPAIAWIAGPGSIPNQKVDDQQPLTDRSHHYVPGGQLAKQVVVVNDYREKKPFAVKWRVDVAGQLLDEGSATGQLEVAETRKIPIKVKLPSAASKLKTPGQIQMRASVGAASFTDTFDFRIYQEVPRDLNIAVSTFDPEGVTSRALKRLGVRVQPWTRGQPQAQVAIIGRNALVSGAQPPGDLEAYVREGGRLIVFSQEARWLRHALHLRTAPQLARQAFVVPSSHPVTAKLDATDLSYWNGSSTATEGYPRYPAWEWEPKFGWRWGNRHAVSSAPIEKPHRSSWTPLVEQEFDLAYTPLMEMRHGAGLVLFNTFDLEGRTRRDPVAERLLRRAVRYVASVQLTPKPDRVRYLGGSEGRKLLDDLGVRYTPVGYPDASAKLLLIGPDVGDSAALRRYIEGGGHALFLPRSSAEAPLGVELKHEKRFLGATQPPAAWPQARGLTVSDLRYRVGTPAWVVQDGPDLEVTAAGQLARLRLGKGLAVFVQLSPKSIPADDKRYLRLTRWRQTRALSQVLANLSASFQQDTRFFELLKSPDHYVSLAKHWQVQPVHALAESPNREWNAKQPMSEKARKIIQGTADAGSWQEVMIPGYLEGYGPEWRWLDGEFVYETQVRWPAHAANKPAILSLGRVDETEASFVNRKLVGRSSHWVHPRAHRVPKHLMRAGSNTLHVRLWDEGIHGGMVGDPSQLFIKVNGKDPGFYHPDYVTDLPLPGDDEETWEKNQKRWGIADEPYRYVQW